MGQPAVTRFKQARLNTATIAAAPTDSPSTSPQFVTSPQGPGGVPTTGILFMIKLAPASTAAGPFTVTPWLRDPVTGQWGSGLAFTANVSEMWVSYDFDAAELYFQTVATADGLVILEVAEQ